MNELVQVALITGVATSIPATIAALAAYRQARGANRAVNGVGKDEPPLLAKVDAFIQRVEYVVDRLKNLETALASVTKQGEENARLIVHVSDQASEAAKLAASVKADLDAKSANADVVPADADVGAAADAAARTPDPDFGPDD